jgi:hypothetical protein
MKDKSVSRSGNNIDKAATGREVIGSQSSSSEIQAFLKAARTANPSGSGKLVFALDATMSRQPTWDRAMRLQASMFETVSDTKAKGGAPLSVQLVYFRGYNECRASKWVIRSAALRDLMTGIDCRGGRTQIGKVLSHTLRETAKAKVDALVFIGDAMEENIDTLCQSAGELGIKGTRCFLFQEGTDPVAEQAFREIAKLTRGAYFRLGPNSAKELADLLGAIAVYARGGLKALQSSKKASDQKLLGRIS